MPRITNHLLALATLSISAAVLCAQVPAPAAPDTQTQPAPIERVTPPSPNGYHHQYPRHPRQLNTMATLAAGQAFSTTNNTATARPTPGVLLRVGQHSTITPISVDPHHTELRLDHGLLNLNVHYASDDELILVDLPGGQTHPLKNGLYTFNAQTNTVRVLKGEAEAFPASAPNAKPLKVKEDHAVTFTGNKIRSTEFEPFQARADLIPYPVEPGEMRGDGGGNYPQGYAGFAPYGDGFYGGYDYPYYGYGYGYPYGFGGYPFGFGLGFGYYGGFGGFRGGYGGFHGGGFHGHR
jgi:hypothetical protein